jgi:ketosteroid isomerase-like protein
MNMILELILATTGLVSSPDAARQQVICAETGFSRAAEAKDQDRFLSFVHPDARFVTGSVARGREEVKTAWAAAFTSDGPTMRWRPQYVEVSDDGLLALSRGPYRSTSVDENGELQDSWGHFISTWRRNDEGVWQVMFDSGGDAGMQPTAEEITILESEPECP